MKLAVRILLGGAVFVAGFIAVRLAFFAPDPWERYLVRSMAPEDPVRPESSSFSQAFHTENAWIINNIARRSLWTEDDAVRLAHLLGSGFPDVPEESIRQDGPDLEAWVVFSMAVAVVSDRIRWGVPTDPRVTEALALTSVDLLDHPLGHARSLGVSTIIGTGMADKDPLLLQRIERMARSDRDPFVRRGVRHSLDLRAGRPVMLDECPTCPKEDP